MRHWLVSNAQLDRFVWRAVKQMPDAGCKSVTAMAQHLMYLEGIAISYALPDEDWVYVSLLRLMKRGSVERYVHESTGGIKYRLSAYPRSFT